MSRFAPLLLGVLVTALFLGYGRFAWSWVAGPVAAAALWALDRRAQAGFEPTPVD